MSKKSRITFLVTRRDVYLMDKISFQTLMLSIKGSEEVVEELGE